MCTISVASENKNLLQRLTSHDAGPPGEYLHVTETEGGKRRSRHANSICMSFSARFRRRCRPAGHTAHIKKKKTPCPPPPNSPNSPLNRCLTDAGPVWLPAHCDLELARRVLHEPADPAQRFQPSMTCVPHPGSHRFLSGCAGPPPPGGDNRVDMWSPPAPSPAPCGGPAPGARHYSRSISETIYTVTDRWARSPVAELLPHTSWWAARCWCRYPDGIPMGFARLVN
jgi:hypothetical protein